MLFLSVRHVEKALEIMTTFFGSIVGIFIIRHQIAVLQGNAETAKNHLQPLVSIKLFDLAHHVIVNNAVYNKMNRGNRPTNQVIIFEIHF